MGRRLPALRGLSLHWAEGERLLLLGPSGSGKSTLALCLNGIIPHSLEAHWEAGRVLVWGRDTRQAGLGELTRRVGVLFQDPEAQLVMLEVDDEIAFGLENQGVPREAMRLRVQAARELVRLDPARTPSRLDQLSGGAKQRVVLASLLAVGPAALVLDEPTANLDPEGARHVLAVVGQLCARGERSLLLVEHRIDEALPLIDRVAVLDHGGRLALEGRPDAVFGAYESQLAALGVWTPQLAALARLLDPRAAPVPRSAADAADLLVRLWPSGAQGETPAGGHGERMAGSSAGARPSVGRPASATPLLALRNVSFRYPRGTVAALEDVSLAISAGEFVALVGPNAAGKSTLGLLLAGVLAPTTGTLSLDGRDRRTISERELRRRLSYVFQYPEHQFVARTVRDDVLFGLHVRGVASADAARRADAILEQFGLSALAEASPYSLSHGQKRRLSVAAALVTDPELIILDEPTFGQDRRHTDELMAVLRDLHRRGRTIVVITHDLALVAEYAERAVALAAGRVVFDGPPHALFARPEVLAQCGLSLPPVAEAVALARRRRPDIPEAISLGEVRALLRARSRPAGEGAR